VVAGILPAVVLALLMILPPLVFYSLATLQGNQTGKMRELSVQNYYFFFLFVQVFLVVSIASVERSPRSLALRMSHPSPVYWRRTFPRPPTISSRT
jgi:hypothetical protein